ncbi:hypothetical protein FRC06_001352 [Ceratobasidium sp. 370]|nr:hypothetical protein FRC06_001352 [Ceratobasidium sp. 370]
MQTARLGHRLWPLSWRSYATSSTSFVPPSSLPVTFEAVARPRYPPPPSSSFFTGRHEYNDSVSQLQDALNLAKRQLAAANLLPLPQGLRNSLPIGRTAWKNQEGIALAVGSRLKTSQYRHVLSLLGSLNALRSLAEVGNHREVMNGLAQVLKRYERIDKDELLAMQKKPVTFDSFGRSYTLGKRKESAARVWVIPTRPTAVAAPESTIEKEVSRELSLAPKMADIPITEILVNNVPFGQYFRLPRDREKAVRPLQVTGLLGAYNVFALVRGGGVSGQAGAVAHGIAKALAAHAPHIKPILVKDDGLRRDPRMVERKKTGLAKARKRLQKTLDTQGLELVENQKESVVGRKGLADKTKEFKKLPEEEKPEAFKGLLKAYQNEIDTLTKRCKASDNAFLGVYKLLAEAPDPYPLLNSVVDMMVKVSEAKDKEAELQALREDNTELKRQVVELGDAKKKVDTLEEKMDSMIQSRVSQKENELNATYDEKMRNYEEREQDLQRQLTLTKSQLRDLRASHDTSQAKLLDHSQRQEQEVDAKLAEMDLIVADLERANSRVAAVERRNEILRAEIETLRTGSDSVQRIQSLENQLGESDAEAQRLRVAFEELKRTTSESISAAEKRLSEAEKEASARAAEIEGLRTRMKQYADYDEIKRELGIMKFVEFGQDDDEEAPMPDPNADKANLQRGQSLEGLLMVKNRKLLEELTKIRVLHSELEASLQAVSEEVVHTRAELDKQTSLNEKLENDLLHINQRALSGAPEKGESTLAPQDGLTGLNLGQKSTDIERSVTPQPDNSILPIVTSQRDRFRQRNAELEEELRKQFESISELRSEVKSLQSDNMKLYEKVRYMQSYRDEGSASWSSLAVPQASNDLGKYRTMYEDSLNPFQAFRGQYLA